MTEEEAKTKTCCGPIPVLIGLAITANPKSTDIPQANCIASACMAWRVRAARTYNDKGTKHHFPASGYCGLAGAPQ